MCVELGQKLCATVFYPSYSVCFWRLTIYILLYHITNNYCQERLTTLAHLVENMPMMMMHKLQQSAVYNWLQGGGSDHLQWSGGIRLYNRISSVHSAIPCVMMLFSVCGVSLLMRCWLGMREQGPRSANHLLPHHNEEGDIRRK